MYFTLRWEIFAIAGLLVADSIFHAWLSGSREDESKNQKINKLDKIANSIDNDLNPLSSDIIKGLNSGINKLNGQVLLYKNIVNKQVERANSIGNNLNELNEQTLKCENMLNELSSKLEVFNHTVIVNLDQEFEQPNLTISQNAIRPVERELMVFDQSTGLDK